MKNQQIRRDKALNKARRATFILGVMILVAVILSVNISAVIGYTGNGEFSDDVKESGAAVDEIVANLTALTNGVITETRLGSASASPSNSTTYIIQNNVILAEKEFLNWNYDDDVLVTFELSDYSDIISSSVDSGNFVVKTNISAGVTAFTDISYTAFSGTLFNYSAQDMLAIHPSGGHGPLYTFNETSGEVGVAVTLVSPENNAQSNDDPQIFTSTLTPGGYNLTNGTVYVWHDTGTLFATETNSTFSDPSTAENLTFSVSDLVVGNYFWNVLGCDTNNCSFDSNNFSLTWGIVVLSEEYNTPVLEKSNQLFRINISVSDFAISTIILHYNNTNYAGTFENINSSAITAYTSLVTPAIATDTNISFYWNISFTDSSSRIITDANNQTVLDLTIDNCSINTIQILNFTLVNEETQVVLDGAADNTSIKIDLDLYSIDSTTSSAFEFFSFYNETLPARVCISEEIVNSSFKLYAQIEYDADSYAHEFYNIQNYNLNASSGSSQNITLYDLSDNDAQAFKISYKDQSFLPVEAALIQIQRKYIDEGVFKTVEIPKTDAKGETTGQLVLNNVIYSFTIVKEGEILAIFDNVYATCQNPAIIECEINLNSFSSTVDATDFYTSEDFAFTLDYDKTVRTITATFSIPSGAVSTVVLNVTKEDALGTEICSESVTTSAGTLTCVVGNSFGNGTVMAKLYSDGVLKGQGQINLAQSPIDIYGASLVFLGLFIMLTLVGAGLSDNPVLTSIFLIVGAILLFALNLVAHHGFIGATATILWLIIAIILIVIKGGRRT